MLNFEETLQIWKHPLSCLVSSVMCCSMLQHSTVHSFVSVRCRNVKSFLLDFPRSRVQVRFLSNACFIFMTGSRRARSLLSEGFLAGGVSDYLHIEISPLQSSSVRVRELSPWIDQPCRPLGVLPLHFPFEAAKASSSTPHPFLLQRTPPSSTFSRHTQGNACSCPLNVFFFSSGIQ